jgi:hypothetical protein
MVWGEWSSSTCMPFFHKSTFINFITGNGTTAGISRSQFVRIVSLVAPNQLRSFAALDNHICIAMHETMRYVVILCQSFTHVSDECSQKVYDVARILNHCLGLSHEKFPQLTEAMVQSDNAAC